MGININTKVTLGAVAALLVAIIGSTWKFAQKARDLETSMASVQASIAAMKAEQYTVSMAAEAALRLAIANPGMRVPDPRKPDQIIVVDKSMRVAGAADHGGMQ